MPTLPKHPLQMPGKGLLFVPALLGLLLFATTATAGELCVNYVFHESGKSAFKSFNPRNRESVVVAKLDFIPNYIVWEKDFSAVFYSGIHRLEWKVGAIPTELPLDSAPGPLPRKSPPQQLGRLWEPAPSSTFDAPAHRMIDVWYGNCDTYYSFGAPVSWRNTETGEMRTLTEKPAGTYSGCTHPLRLSTADNFILIAEKIGGGDAIIADMMTGEVLLRTGDQSGFAGWGKCPAN